MSNPDSPAYPQDSFTPGVFDVSDTVEAPATGLTCREYAAIMLRVPESGTEWLDEMIRKRLRDELALAALQGLIASETEKWRFSGWENAAVQAYRGADAMLAERKKEQQ